MPLSDYTEAQRVCESCFSRGDVRAREPEGPSYMVQPPLISFGGDDMLSMEQVPFLKILIIYFKEGQSLTELEDIFRVCNLVDPGCGE